MENKNIEIVLTGDFVPPKNPSELTDSELRKFLYDEDLLYELRNADLSITNLEVPLTNSKHAIKKSGPNMSADPKNIRYLKLGGFNLVTLANNHIMDYDGEGLKDTLNICKINDIDAVGAGLDEKHAKKTYLKEIKGKKIAIINTAENEFLTSKRSSFQAHNFDLIDVFQKIHEAKSFADFILLIYHGGIENFQLPYPNMRKNLEFLSKAGVNAIVCHHTHCYSGYEYFEGVPVFYGLGNFFFKRNSKLKSWNEGFVLKLILDFDLNLDFKLLPYTQSVNEKGVRLMKSKALIEFNNSIAEINGILNDSNVYNRKWEALIEKITPKLIKHIYPVNFFSNEEKNLNKHKHTKKITYLFNLIRAESSYACLLKALDKIY